MDSGENAETKSLADLRQEKKLKLERVVKAQRKAYREELTTSWTELNECLADMRSQKDAASRADQAVRVAHTIRGTAALLGWPELGLSAGKLEDIVRESIDRPWQIEPHSFWGRVDSTREELCQVVEAVLQCIEEMPACDEDGDGSV